MGRHKKILVEYPDWIRKSNNPCLESVAEDAYYAKALAVEHGAEKDRSCREIMRAATKSLHAMEDSRAGIKRRCKEGDRAARKFWEAKVCART